jgi:murein DD-endopeptidase MepM/ murein hydrolase activator NlpD
VNIKFYAPFFISLGLALAPTTSHAKPVHHAVKKHSIAHAKPVKTKARRTDSHKTSFKKRTLITASSKRSQTLSRSRHIISLHSNGRKYPIISTHLYPTSKLSDGEQQIETAFNENRIHTVVEPNKTYSFAETGAASETPLHFSSTHGIIESSFSRAAYKAGLSENLITELTRIFAWDIDFASGLHEGDQFTVIYKESASFGNHRNSGQIIAAEFATRGKIFTAVRYKDHNGIASYYSPEGKSMQKAFLSTPVDYARISSHFDSHRKHPVLNRIRAHKGVDYAARTGTPVKSAGDGIVTFRGRKGGYGQVITVKHGERYETLYAHLSDFKKGLENGDMVKQGEVIGYVGQTGLATGPHLHYEFRIDGVHRNPESLNQDRSMPLSSHLMADFKSQTRPVLAQLYQAKARNMLAKNLYNSN